VQELTAITFSNGFEEYDHKYMSSGVFVCVCVCVWVCVCVCVTCL